MKINGILSQFWAPNQPEMHIDKGKNVGVSYLRTINEFLVLNLN